MTRLAMLGAGSLGSLFAHHLALGGADVHIVDLFEEHVSAICSSGLRLDVGGQTIVSPVSRATVQANSLGVMDVVVLFVKTNASRTALQTARCMVGPRTVLVTLQNGLGNAELIQEIFPGNTVLYGLTTLTADLLEPGLIAPRSTEHGVTDVWTVSPSNVEAVERFVKTLKRGGIVARVAPDIDLSIWKKLAVNCALNGLCAITDLTCGQLCAQDQMWPLLDRIAKETAALARGRGVHLTDSAATNFLRTVAKSSAEHYPSMVFDVRRKRITEVDSFNGAVVRGSKALGIDASANQTVMALIKAIEANYGIFRH